VERWQVEEEEEEKEAEKEGEREEVAQRRWEEKGCADCASDWSSSLTMGCEEKGWETMRVSVRVRQQLDACARCRRRSL